MQAQISVLLPAPWPSCALGVGAPYICSSEDLSPAPSPAQAPPTILHGVLTRNSSTTVPTMKVTLGSSRQPAWVCWICSQPVLGPHVWKSHWGSPGAVRGFPGSGLGLVCRHEDTSRPAPRVTGRGQLSSGNPRRGGPQASRRKPSLATRLVPEGPLMGCSTPCWLASSSWKEGAVSGGHCISPGAPASLREARVSWAGPVHTACDHFFTNGSVLEPKSHSWENSEALDGCQAGAGWRWLGWGWACFSPPWGGSAHDGQAIDLYFSRTSSWFWRTGDETI